MREPKKIKILHCPTMVGGNPQGLSKAEKSMGLDSSSLVLQKTFYSYAADRVLFDNNCSFIEREFLRWVEIFCVLKKNDVIHYNFGQSLAPNIIPNIRSDQKPWKVWLYNNLYARWVEFLDLKLARLLGKVVTVTYQGDDARQGDYCKQHYPVHFCHDVDETYYSLKTDIEKRRRIKIFDRYANFIYAVNPDLLNVLPERARFIPYASVDPRDWSPVPIQSTSEDSLLHIVHAPSHRDVKGTKYVLQAFDRLQKEGIKFRYTLVEGLSNQDARKVYETADLLIDQLLAGYYGALAVELMALGKPVICYMRDSDLLNMPDDMRQEIPIIKADPATIYDVLKEIIASRRSELQSIGVRGRRYVEKWHDPQKIAEIMRADVMTVFSKRGVK
ncbi:glycosyltransferase family protein [Micavibrio aeruginosavorus]|uniref:Glycosyl transferase family 1 domain-containing protein n=1 Tax=Micavibrio aeruginosavorus (strain ARL-13) TaxID=856793 RepID=G2KLX3_MICAA|nr:glycosyltransferase [Micavibrio aeruginosavorus]AEP09352.1 putative uncharacterized protein [Micavibrio aeruginosavorus ARL-13]